MPTNTYVALDKVTVGTATPTVTFSSISGSYTDLRIVVQTAVNTETYMRFNADTGSNYSGTEIWAGTSPNSERASNVTFITLRNSSSTLGNNMATVDVMNYSNSTTNKTVLVGTRDGLYDRVYSRVGMWRNTAAITSITFVPDAGNFPVGSTFSLYGISNAGDATPKATGGTVTSDATYWYHTFTMSGNFVPNQSLTCDYLVVAGGGAGGPGYYGGGGGAGGLRSTVTATGGGGSLESALSVTAQTYQVLIGAGGAGGTSSFDFRGTAGSNSSFSTVTSTGGGGGGTFNTSGQTAGGNGGSGGGGGQTSAGGTGTANQGYGGGTASAVTDNRIAGGGGGGAGAAGGNPSGSGSSGIGGAGGNGVATSINGSSITYAGGGGGGYGRDAGVAGGTGGPAGTGGGGAGSTNGFAGSNGQVSTGGGGGGAGGYPQANGSGGSGVVIVRYAK